ncbi:MAG: flavodoxin-dependent (E)-4-hydroxy-3-methylbut-2-enyl-diphosphate synthase [Clostridia bacterium]|nr:flavodoxin-dependent (E)-4-hydroxy-3-methylbut-2-enyl-diphosphate synthase [Clostridia bacterium]
MMERRKTKQVKVGNIFIGSEHPVSVQSMLNTKNSDIEGACAQTQALVDAGCEIVRLAVINDTSIECIKALKKNFSVPIVSDIQFNHIHALKSIEAGVDKVRINPGNIGDDNKVKEVVAEAKKAHIPIRIGVNTGSILPEIRKKYNGVCAEALVEEAMRHVRILEDNNFDDIIISLKASSVPLTIQSYQQIAKMCDYPLHLGVTEAGTSYDGLVKSSVGIGALLSQGIGDTIRVSLTADPVEEIYAAKSILSSLDLKKGGAKLVSCPTCARCSIDLITIANEVSKRLKTIEKDIKVAVMGCVVNGPGEAKDADIGITGAGGEGVIFKGETIIARVPESEIIDALFKEIEEL